MTRNDFLDPQELVATALRCDKKSITSMSEINGHPKWDSFGHLQILLALEKHYGIEIQDRTVTEYQTFHAIQALYDKLIHKEAQMIQKVEEFTSYDGLTLHGTLTSPIGDYKGMALLVHGITSDRDELGFYERMAVEFARNGVASLRFDYRCHGTDSTPMEQMSLLGIVNDIDAAYKHLSKIAGILNGVKVLVGTSFGGGLAAFWACLNPQKVDLLFLCAPVIDYADDIQRNAGDWRVSLHDGGVADYVGNPIGRPLLNEMPYINGKSALHQPCCKTVIFHGSNDDDVPISSSEDYVNSQTDLTLVKIEGVGHGFGVPDDENLDFPETLQHHAFVYASMVRSINALLSNAG